MPLQGGSSAVYWEQAGLDADGEEEQQAASHVSRKRKGEHAGGDGAPAHPAASTSGYHAFRAPSTKSARGPVSAPAPINKDVPEDDDNGDDSDEEFTFNPDQELQDDQADGHAYEAAGQYERIEFGEFGKYMRNKRRKLVVQQDANLRHAKEGETSNTLEGIRIYINGETDPPQHVLCKLIVLHGGRYVPYLDGTKTKATHIIASNLTPSKRVQFKEYKVVTSDWVMDSIILRKVQNWRNYREDQSALRAEQGGTGPAASQIAQPRLNFGAPASTKGKGREESSPANVKPGPLPSAKAGIGRAFLPPSLAPHATDAKPARARLYPVVEIPYKGPRYPSHGHSPPIEPIASTSRSPAPPPRPVALPVPVGKPRPSKIVSPRRLPPPTSDPLTLLHVEGMAVADQAAAPSFAAPSAVERPAAAVLTDAEAIAANPTVNPAWITQGWYTSKPNERSANLLKDEAWRLQETAVNTTEFLTKYYKESRLHWLSTWKAELKKMVSELSEGREVDISESLNRKKKPPLKGTEADGRVVLHVDFDSFFVAVSLLARPHLRGLPVVVCHANVGDVNSSSEIASASYEAREFGIVNGMSLGSARKKCPQLQTVPYDFDLYRSTSAKFYQILFSHAQELEAVSIDEAYVTLRSVETPRTAAQLLEEAEAIRSEIREATGCSTSIGVSHNKLLARLATNRAKPSSSFQIGNGTDASGESLKAFLKDIDVEKLPGIGWKRGNEIEEKLAQLAKRLTSGHFAPALAGKGQSETETVEEQSKDRDAQAAPFSRVGDMLQFSKNQMKEALGEKTGEMLYNYARGVDNRVLEMDSVRKSVSAEVNYGIRFKTALEVETFCMGLGKEVASRLAKLAYKGRQLTLKVMRRAAEAPIEPPKFLGHGVCDTFNSSKAVELTSDPVYIGKTCWELMRSLACPPEELRGIGLQMQKLESVKEGLSGFGGDGGNEGQARLSFKVVPKNKQIDATVQPAPAATVPAEGVLPSVDGPAPSPILLGTPNLPRSPIVIGTGPISSSPYLLDPPSRPAPPVGRSLRSRAPSNYIDLSSEDEQGNAAAGPRRRTTTQEDGFKMLSQAPSDFRDKPRQGQMHLGGQVTKRTRSISDKPEAIVITATSPAFGPPPRPAPAIPSPTRLTDQHLVLLGLDVAIFRSFGKASQSEILKECLIRKGESKEVQEILRASGIMQKKAKGKKARSSFAPVFEEAAANAAKREEARRREQDKLDKATKGPVYIQLISQAQQGQARPWRAPVFGGKTEAADVQRVLASWMKELGTDHAPSLDEVEILARFCLAVVSRDPAKNGGKGPDVAKVAAILSWWKYLIDNREKSVNDFGSQRLAVDGWRQAWADINGRVSAAISEHWEAPFAGCDH